jgi:hypothetical protein
LVTLLGSANEDEMIATFIRAELESPRFGAKLRSAAADLGASIALLADGTSAHAAEARRRLLAAYRGWGQYESVFGGMPDDLEWSWAELDEAVLRTRVFTIKWWFEETFGTRSVLAIGEMKRRTADDDSRPQLEQARAAGRMLEPPILLSEPDLRRLVILEGHSRILSYMAHPDLAPFPMLALIGTSPRIGEWSEW